MKRLLPVLFAVALVVPVGQAHAAKVAKARKAKAVVESCSGDKDVKSVSLGKEVIYANADKTKVSFTRSEATPIKYDLVYFCAEDNYFQKTPGVGPKGHALVPGFRHGDTWYALSKDENGNPVLANAPASVIDAAPAASAPMIDATSAEKSAKKAKKTKRAKGEKKAKKAKKEAKVEGTVSDVVPGSEPAPAGR